MPEASEHTAACGAAQPSAPCKSATARWGWLDAARGVGIVLVCVGHYIPAQLYGNALVWGVLKAIYSFHVPLFFFLSGLTVQPAKGSLFSFARKKARAILAPWFAFILLGTALRLCSGSIVLREVPGAFLFGNLATPAAWFLPVLFLAQVLWAILVRFANKLCAGVRLRALLLFGVTGALWALGALAAHQQWKWPFRAHTVLCCLAFLALGALTKRVLPRTEQLSRAAKGSLGALLLAASTALAQLWPVCYSLSDMQLPNYPAFLLTGLLGSLGTVLCCMALPRTKLLQCYGRHSLFICLTHGYWVSAYGLLGPLVRPAFGAAQSYNVFMLAAGGAWFVMWMLLYVPLGRVLERHIPRCRS